MAEEQRHRSGGTLPSTEGLDEAYRNVYNLYMQYQGLGTLATVLEQATQAREALGTLEQAIADARQEQATLDQSIAILRQQQQTVGAEYTRQRGELDVAHEEYRQAILQAQRALEEPLSAARQELDETRREAQKLKVTMRADAQQAARAEQIRHETELAKLRGQKGQLDADIEARENRLAELQTQMNALIRQLSGVA